MYPLIPINVKVVRNLTSRSPLRRGFLLIPLALACLALSSQARAVCQEGCNLSNGDTFLGDDALVNDMIGSNTAIGSQALHSNNYGIENTATGAYALYSNSGFNGGSDNTATGAYALYSNNIGNGRGSFGIDNTATGVSALFSNTTGFANTASGVSALADNTNGYSNTANGASALAHNTTANNNTANGCSALGSNTTGFQNTANGSGALFNNITGNRNVAEGASALFTNGFGNFNTAVGFQALYQNSGSNNVALGFNAGTNLTTGSGNVCIGYSVLGIAGESNTTRINNIYSSVASGRAVYINSDNKIGTLVSSRRFKDEIKSMDKASEGILALKPVTFHYKKEIEPNGAIMFGLIAEEVEKVDPDLITRNDKGEPETVRYEAVNAMLLNEFLKEHRKVEELKTTVAKQAAIAVEQQAEIKALTTSLKEQALQIQKVSDQLGVSKAAPRLVENR
jgi:hypothetical protein